MPPVDILRHCVFSRRYVFVRGAVLAAGDVPALFVVLSGSLQVYADPDDESYNRSSRARRANSDSGADDFVDPELRTQEVMSVSKCDARSMPLWCTHRHTDGGGCGVVSGWRVQSGDCCATRAVGGLLVGGCHAKREP